MQENAVREALRIDDVSFAYGGFLVLREIDVSVRHGEFVSIIGPSGCGKSTLLSVVSGALEPSIGSVSYDESGQGTERAVVFQDFALLPWKSVRDNVAIGLNYQRRDLSAARRREIAQNYVELVGLRGFEDKFPYQISGGMRQRVGIARALAVEPRVLLLDEPLASIDAQNAEILRKELLDLVVEQNKTAVLVTHNLDEALFLSDRVLLMSTRPGRIAADIRIDLPYPRGTDMADPEDQIAYANLRARLWSHLVSEVAQEKEWMAAVEEGGA